jgi:hypothetical protein
MNAAIDRQAVEKQIRLEMQGSFDYQPWDVQKSLVDTRMRALQANQPASVEQVLVVRERVRPQPQHLTPPPLPKSDAAEKDLRQRLKEAQAEHEAAVAKVTEGKAFVERAQDHLSNHETKLAAYRELDVQAASLQVEQIKQQAHIDLPHHLQMEFRERGELIDRIQVASKALDRLQSEQKTAERESVLALERLHYCIRDVACCYAFKLLEQLADAEDSINGLRCLLASCHLKGPPGAPLHLPPEVAAALEKRELQAPEASPEFSALWDDLAERLLTDADAMPDTDLILDVDNAE